MKPGGGSVHAVRAGVVGRLRARRGELVEVIFARVRGDAFGVVGAQDAEYVAGLGAAVAAAVEYVLTGIERGAEGVGPIPPAVSEQARRAARIGVSLDTVLRRYVVGHSVLEDFIMEEVDRDETDWMQPAQREALREALRAQASVLDRLLVAITSEYGDELQRAGRSPEQRRTELVKRLLDGEMLERPELDYELDAWHLGVIATGPDAARAVRTLATGMDRRLLSVSHDERSVWAWLGGSERFVAGELERVVSEITARAGDDPRLQPPAGNGVVLATGEPARGLAGWRLTHQQAQAALVVALRRPRPLTRYGDVALLATALKDEPLARSLIDIYLSPLKDSRGGGQVLRETLRAYLDAERSVSSAAAALGVVRKTVESRLRTVEERLGRTLHPCPVELEVALLLDELAATPRPPEFSTIGEIIS
jgi:hypothetical protein